MKAADKSKILVFLFFVAAVLLDQATKMAAIMHLKDKPPVQVIPGVFEFQYLENSGAAFGLFPNGQLFFVAIAAAILIFGKIFYSRLPASKRYFPLKACIVCIAAGALGNMIDRVAHGYVVDFLYFSLIHFPVFNVADIYVTAATAVLFLLVMFYYKEEDFQRK